mmetsp:Transcript_11468/g.19593  ORF Transcript_11468/g.19593 Transcript_11468/m.19593 type:complete len:248 (+) Transcript_11468:166-909(+)
MVAWSNTSLSAFRTSKMLRLSSVQILRPSMLRPASLTSSGTVLRQSTACARGLTPHATKAAAIFLVFMSANVPARSSTTTMLPAAFCRAELIARRRSFLFMLMVQSLGLGPKRTPPPGFRGVRRDPRRALPVPFCAIGFLPPPRTSERVSVDAVPRRAFCWCMTMYLCTRPEAEAPAVFTSRVAEPLALPSTVTFSRVAASILTGIVARLAAMATGRAEVFRERPLKDLEESLAEQGRAATEAIITD